MDSKKAILEFQNDTNQLSFKGSPATYADYTSVVSYVTDEAFDSDGVPVINRKFILDWAALNDSYSPIYAKFRVRNETLNTQSDWFTPTLLYTPVRYRILKRRVSPTYNEWTSVEITTKSSGGPYHENWDGRVQYCVAIYHRNGIPTKNEGNSWTGNFPTDVSNPYVLFMTNPNDSLFDTRPRIIPL